jgi:ribonuclease HII
MRIAGVDQAGRGPLAGPVVAAAVILDPARPIAGLADSKTLSEAERRRLARCIRERASAYAIGIAECRRDRRDRYFAGDSLAMRRATIVGLAVRPTHLEVDGNRSPRLEGIDRARAGRGRGEGRCQPRGHQAPPVFSLKPCAIT